MAQQFSWYKNLSVDENMILSATLYGMNKDEAKENCARILKFVGLYQFKKTLSRKIIWWNETKISISSSTCA